MLGRVWNKDLSQTFTLGQSLNHSEGVIGCRVGLDNPRGMPVVVSSSLRKLVCKPRSNSRPTAHASSISCHRSLEMLERAA
jgi:hypothetical protein